MCHNGSELLIQLSLALLVTHRRSFLPVFGRVLFAVGALLAGLVADAFGILAAIWVVAALTAISGLVVAVRMYETRPARSAAALAAG